MRQWAVLSAFVAVAGTIYAQAELERTLCEPADPKNQCPGATCACVEDRLEVVFPSGNEIENSVFEYEKFQAGMEVTTAVVIDTKSAGTQGFSFGVRHDAGFLEIVSLLPQPDLFFNIFQCGDHHGGPRAVENGYIYATVLSFIGDCELPVQRNIVCQATYRLLQDPGARGARLQFSEDLRVADSPTVDIDLTIDGRSKRPLKVIDGLIKRVDARFLRGDVNEDSKLDLTDGIRILTYLFARAEAPACRKAADANDDGRLDLTDAIRIFLHLFGAAGVLPEPFSKCGKDPSPDRLECERFAPCV